MAIAILDALDSKTPDVAISSTWYATRFLGKTGEWFLKVQEEAVLEAIREWPQGAVLDVGGGHGQLTAGLVRSGYRVTVLDSHEVCREQIERFIQSGACHFEVGDIEKFPFPGQSFDFVISVRMMPHARNWKAFLTELKRVARKAVVIDFAVLESVNFLAENLFWLKRYFEGNTTGYVVYHEREVLAYCAQIGLRLRTKFRQYFLPMSFHRFLKQVQLSKKLEAFSRRLGLTDRFGSPVIACFIPELKEKA